MLELVTGWSNGKIDIRNTETGEMIFKDKFAHGIAGVIAADYNLDGIEELIVCSVSGEVRGYASTKKEKTLTKVDLNAEQDTIRDFMRKKQSLLLELRNIEGSTNFYQKEDIQLRGKASTEDDEYGAIPANTQLKSALFINMDDDKVMIGGEKRIFNTFFVESFSCCDSLRSFTCAKDMN